MSTLKNLQNLYLNFKKENQINWKDKLKLFCILYRSSYQNEFINLEEDLLEHISSFDVESLTNFSKMIRSDNSKKHVENYVINNISIFTPAQLMKIAILLKSEELLSVLEKKGKIDIQDFKDLISAVNFTNKYTVLVELAKIANELSGQASFQALIKIIEIFEIKYPDLTLNLVEKLENKLFSAKTRFSVDDIRKVMHLLRLQGIHLLFSKNFKLQFENLVFETLESLKFDRPTFYLIMLSKEGYYSCKIYSRLINELFIQGPYSVNFQQLITSLHGISKFHYFCERLKGLFKNVVENSIQSAGHFEVKNILRIMILQNYYDEQVLNITLEKFKELTDSRITLDNYSYHVLMQLKLDCPEKSEVLNKFLERIKPGPLEAHMLSKTHGYISEILKSFNYEYKESVVIFNVYEADFLIEKEKIIVDAIGTLYHFANTDYILSPKELIRIKHLVKLGYKVILTVNRESTVKNLKKAIFVLTHFKNQNLVVLTENKLEFFDVFGNIKLLNG